MLEYLLERPVDAPIFANARLKFLVLDEADAHRAVQATEIAFAAVPTQRPSRYRENDMCCHLCYSRQTGR